MEGIAREVLAQAVPGTMGREPRGSGALRAAQGKVRLDQGAASGLTSFSLELSLDPKGRGRLLRGFKLRDNALIINTGACCILFIKVLEQVKFWPAVLQRHSQVNSYLKYDALHTSMPFNMLLPRFGFFGLFFLVNPYSHFKIQSGHRLICNAI